MKYRLKKDLPGVPAGTEAERNEMGGFPFMSEMNSYYYSKQQIDRFSDFFELAEEKKEIIFTTHDGVDVYDDSIGTVYGILLHPSDKVLIEKTLPWDSKNGRFAENRVWFADKEKAKEYLIAHYPCLSHADVSDQPRYAGRLLVIEKLKKIVPELF